MPFNFCINNQQFASALQPENYVCYAKHKSPTCLEGAEAAFPNGVVFLGKVLGTYVTVYTVNAMSVMLFEVYNQ